MTRIFKVLMLIGLFLTTTCAVQAKGWETLKGEDFILYYRPAVPEDFVGTVMDSAEEDFRNISENLGITRYHAWSLDKPISIYIYTDADDYVHNGGQASWSHAATLVKTKTIKTYPSDEGFFDALLPHELGHIILHEYLGPYADMPLWFDEGVAMYQEKAKRIGSNKFVQEAISNGQFIPLSRLTDMRLYMNSDKKTVDIFYAESASIVNFMITQLGQGHFYEFCVELQQNSHFIDALLKVYGNIDGLDGLNKKWLNYLKDSS